MGHELRRHVPRGIWVPFFSFLFFLGDIQCQQRRSVSVAGGGGHAHAVLAWAGQLEKCHCGVIEAVSAGRKQRHR